MNKKYLIALSFVSALAISCGEEAEEKVDEQITKDTMKNEVNNDLGMISVNIPYPTETSKKMKEAGYSYNKAILNPASKGSSYSTRFQAATNLGVYAADLGYVASFNQNGDASEYINQIVRLAQQVKLESALDPEYMKSMATAQGEVLRGKVDTIFAKAQRNVRSNDRVATAALVIAGGWVEGLHVACESIGTKSKDAKNADLYFQIYNQCYAYNYVVDLLKHYQSDPDCKKMLDELKPHESKFASYSKKANITQADIPGLKEAVAALRSKIVS